MKTLIVASLLVLFTAMSAKADYVTLAIDNDNPTNSLVLVAGESAELVWSSTWPGTQTGQFAYWKIETPKATLATATTGNTALTGIRIAGPATFTFWITGARPFNTVMMTFNKFSASPNTVNVIPKGQGAVITLQTTFDLGGQWTTLFSQAFTNSTPTNQFFKFTMSAP